METTTELVYQSVFDSSPARQEEARITIRENAKKKHIRLASTYSLYKAFARGEVKNVTIPAFNIRNLTYDFARLVFRLMKELDIGLCIFEIARGEVTYTSQTHDEYATTILAAALAEQWDKEVFLQADHTQFSAVKYTQDSKGQIEVMKDIIKKAIYAGFYNIDIDASTLVDLSRSLVDEQQKENAAMTAELLRYIRTIELDGLPVSVGGEIGHIGGKNSTEEEFEAFMRLVSGLTGDLKHGLSKISVQTGTSHGGILQEDGTIKQVALDFVVHTRIGSLARTKYGLAGSVQHGASTLPLSLFHRFPQTGVPEVHLATEFQNILFETIPQQLKQEMYMWLKEKYSQERKQEQTEEQFYYSVRKRANGPFKKRIWMLSNEEKKPIFSRWEKELKDIFTQLNLVGSRRDLEKHI